MESSQKKRQSRAFHHPDIKSKIYKIELAQSRKITDKNKYFYKKPHNTLKIGFVFSLTPTVIISISHCYYLFSINLSLR